MFKINIYTYKKYIYYKFFMKEREVRLETLRTYKIK